MNSTGNEGGAPPRVVIFDVDQTLLYTLKRFYKVFNATLNKFDLDPVSWEKFLELYSRDSPSTVFEGRVDRDDFWKIFLEDYDIECREDRPIEGAEEALRRAKELGLRVIVATGRRTPVESLRREMERFGLAKYVDSFYTAREDPWVRGYAKVGMMRRILEREKLRPEEVIMVADYLPDMELARRMGMRAIAVLTGLMPEGELRRRGAQWVIESIAQLPTLLERILKDP